MNFKLTLWAQFGIALLGVIFCLLSGSTSILGYLTLVVFAGLIALLIYEKVKFKDKCIGRIILYSVALFLIIYATFFMTNLEYQLHIYYSSLTLIVFFITLFVILFLLIKISDKYTPTKDTSEDTAQNDYSIKDKIREIDIPEK